MPRPGPLGPRPSPACRRGGTSTKAYGSLPTAPSASGGGAASRASSTPGRARPSRRSIGRSANRFRGLRSRRQTGLGARGGGRRPRLRSLDRRGAQDRQLGEQEGLIARYELTLTRRVVQIFTREAPGRSTSATDHGRRVLRGRPLRLAAEVIHRLLPAERRGHGVVAELVELLGDRPLLGPARVLRVPRAIRDRVRVARQVALVTGPDVVPNLRLAEMLLRAVELLDVRVRPSITMNGIRLLQKPSARQRGRTRSPRPDCPGVGDSGA